MLDAICSRISHFSTIRSLGVSVAPWLLWLAVPLPIHAQNHTVAEIEARIAQLEQELSLARSELAEARQSQRGASGTDGIRVGPVSIGGAVRVNFVRGSYLDTGSGPARGGDGGNMELDTFRINAGLVRGPLIGQLEYRWYDGYNFLHTGWLGWAFEDESRVQVGVARVPFGPGPYGISKSWFYDQHYYVGLADDMDLGLAYHTRRGRWDLDIAYFTGSGGNWSGVSEDSTRYSYDVVRWRESVGQDGTVTYGESVNGYDEDGQLNARAIYRLGSALSPSSELGVSLQHGRIDGVGNDDGTHWAGSVHLISRAGGLELASQLTRYEYDIDADNPLGTDELVPMGAYDFAWPAGLRGHGKRSLELAVQYQLRLLLLSSLSPGTPMISRNAAASPRTRWSAARARRVA